MNKKTALLISEIFNLKRLIFEKIKKEISINPDDFLHLEILRFTNENKKPLMKSLAEHLRITRPSATSLVNRLVKKNYLQRIFDKDDHRQIKISLTKHGQEILKSHCQKMQKLMSKTFSELTDNEIENLQKIYKKIGRCLTEK